MAEPTWCCPHSGDLDGCANSLIQACAEARLAQHCHREGLIRGHTQCRDLLLVGLTGKPGDKGATTSNWKGASPELTKASEAAEMEGYRAGCEPFRRLLYEAFHRLVRHVLHKHGVTADADADNAVNEVFFAVDKHILKGHPIQCMSAFFAKAARNWALRHGREYSVAAVQAEVLDKPAAPSAVAWIISPENLERWENLDHYLAKSEHGDLTNRIIFGQHIVGGSFVDEKQTVAQLRADWGRLAENLV
jgi:hypothetical protein